MREPLRDDDPVRIGVYRLLGRLGEGGMGVVYLAQDPGEDVVALKVVRPQLATQTNFRTRFRDELEAAAKVAPFCTAPILDADTNANPPYVVTEYIDGPTLNSVVDERGPLTGSQLHALGVGVASALAAIHHAGVIHRDLKPGNVLLSRFGPRVIDFGIARSLGSPGHITESNVVMGSPSFMAPEQWQGKRITPQADIFAWGALMAYAGTGREPFTGPGDAVPYQIVHGEPDLDGLDPSLKDLVMWALTKDSNRRPTATQLLDALVGGSDPVPSGATPQPRVLAEGPVPSDTSGRGTSGPRGRHGRRRGVGLWVWCVLLTFILLGAAAGGGIVYYNFTASRDGSVAAVNSYLDNIESTRFSEAFDQLCPEVQNVISREDFVRRAEAAPQVLTYTVDDGSVPFTVGNTYTVRAEVRREGGSRVETFIVVAFDRKGPSLYLVCPRG